MGWFSSLVSGIGSTAGKLAGSIGGSFSLQDATGGWSTYSATQSLRKDQMEREMAMAERLAKRGPSWTVEGLREAGINPMIAAESANSWSGQRGSLGGQAQGGGSSFGFKSKLDRATTEKQQENIDADTTLKSDQGKAAKIQAEATMLNALNSSRKVDAEIELMKKQGSSLDVRNPSESPWGIGSYITNNLGGLAAGAFGVKAIYDMAKNWSSSKPVNTVGQSKTSYIKPTSPKNNVIKPLSKPKVGPLRTNVKPNSASAMKAYAPLAIGELLDRYNQKYGFPSFTRQVKTHSNKIPSFYNKKTYIGGRK